MQKEGRTHGNFELGQGKLPFEAYPGLVLRGSNLECHDPKAWV